MRSAILSFVLVLLGITGAHAQTSDIREGQVWTFKNSSAAARLVVQKIEPYGQGLQVVHVSIYGLPQTGTFAGTVSHLPFNRKALEASLDKITNDKPRADLGFAEGYQEWKNAQGGVFTITVAEVTKLLADQIR